MFNMELHHGGKFVMFLGMRYIDGLIAYIDMVDINQFSIHELYSLMSKLGYVAPPPNEGFNSGPKSSK